jgi:hypothetical protein
MKHRWFAALLLAAALALGACTPAEGGAGPATPGAPTPDQADFYDGY